ncbi:MAG: sugar kinase [Kiritimatiellae bacterium]|nr:sugar kinase [Kiritimatiellia bacterium]
MPTPLKKSLKSRLIVVGSIGLDSIETPYGSCTEVLGGSAVYACAAASFHTRTGMVGIVGHDFPAHAPRTLSRMGVDLRGFQSMPGRTFRWSGVYSQNMDERSTRCTELNVFAEFRPELPPSYRSAGYIFLANVAPALQLRVLDQIRRPKFVLADTMDMWIRETPSDLREVLRRVDMIAVNESEARHLSGIHNLLAAAAHIRKMGPRWVLVKKGEHGSLLIGPGDTILVPAYPLEEVRDPTGAGDAFAGGFMGVLASERRITGASLRRAMLAGTVIASFAVEDFSIKRLARLRPADLRRRTDMFRRMCHFALA